ncbi:hypothetical protein Tco_0044160, partial [Tanacetum coccineum]
MVKIPRCMQWLDTYDEPIGDLDMMEDEVDNRSPQSMPQVLPSFKEYTLPVTYPEEVEDTLGTLIKVETLDQTKLEDIGLNTCNDDIPLSFREVPSFDEPKPQPQPLPNCLSLDVSLGDERGPKPPINPLSLNSFRMKSQARYWNKNKRFGNGYLRKGQKRSQNDKIEHGMEKREKVKVKVNKVKVKVNPDKVKSQSRS